NGSLVQPSSGPGGTTSVWPARQTSGGLVPQRAHRLVTPLTVSVSQWNPSGARRAAMIAWQPASSGVSERRAISARVSSRTLLVGGAGSERGGTPATILRHARRAAA